RAYRETGAAAAAGGRRRERGLNMARPRDFNGRYGAIYWDGRAGRFYRVGVGGRDVQVLNRHDQTAQLAVLEIGCVACRRRIPHSLAVHESNVIHQEREPLAW